MVGGEQDCHLTVALQQVHACGNSSRIVSEVFELPSLESETNALNLTTLTADMASGTHADMAPIIKCLC